jgi:hypothetical protein
MVGRPEPARLAALMRRYTFWRERRQLLVHLLAAFGAMFWLAEQFPGRVPHRLVAAYSAGWCVDAAATIGAAVQEWRSRAQIGRHVL